MPTTMKCRTVIVLKGDEPVGFLQGLITQDMRQLQDPGVLYGLFLTQRGRYFCDAFIFLNAGNIYLDVPCDQGDALLSRLNLYKMRRQLTIEKTSLRVVVSRDQLTPDHEATIGFEDPRFKGQNNPLGYRYLVQDPSEFSSHENVYHHLCISLGIPSHGHELIPDKTIPAEAHMDQLNAVSYDKGCYVGQELTSRTHYVGEVRRGYMPFRFETPLAPDFPLLKDSSTMEVLRDVYLAEESIGILTSLYPQGGIARVSLDALVKARDSGVSCTLMDHNIIFFKPSFLG